MKRKKKIMFIGPRVGSKWHGRPISILVQGQGPSYMVCLRKDRESPYDMKMNSRHLLHRAFYIDNIPKFV